MIIKLTIEQVEYVASLNESQAAVDFLSLLPMTLTLEDYAGTEKISNLPQQLSVTGSPGGTSASKGDIMYYAPWGNLALFYRDFRYAGGLVKLGEFESEIESLARIRNDIIVTIEKID